MGKRLASLSLVIAAAIWSSCDIEPERLQSPAPAVTEGSVTIDDDVMVITGNGKTATITLTSQGHLARYGDFNVLYRDPVRRDGKIVEVRFTEWTSTDKLDVQTQILGYRHVVERYVRGDQVLELEVVDAVTPEQYAQLAEFFGQDKGYGSVMGHPDGMILATLIEDNLEQIAEIVRGKGHRPQWAVLPCNLAAICVSVKCWFGGPANSACVGCAAMTVFCLVMDMVGWPDEPWPWW